MAKKWVSLECVGGNHTLVSHRESELLTISGIAHPPTESGIAGSTGGISPCATGPVVPWAIAFEGYVQHFSFILFFLFRLERPI